MSGSSCPPIDVFLSVSFRFISFLMGFADLRKSQEWPQLASKYADMQLRLAALTAANPRFLTHPEYMKAAKAMTLILELAPEVEAKLQQQAALLGITVPDLVIKMVEDTVTKEAEPKKPYGAAAALQLAEEIHATIPEEEWSKLPPDWATNPDKYRFSYAKDEA